MQSLHSCSIPPLFPQEDPVTPRLGAALADSLAAVRVALELLSVAGEDPAGEVARLGRHASRTAGIHREQLAALARARSLPLPPAASEACTVVRRSLARVARSDEDASVTVACPGEGALPVAVAVPVLEELWRSWWRGMRSLVTRPRRIVIERAAGEPLVDLRVASDGLEVPPRVLEVACGRQPLSPLRALPLPVEAWFLPVAAVLARRVGGEVLPGREGPVLRLPAWPRN